ncbi:helix-turn-helix domain-containing protein [Salinifilum aidingensis]
MSNTWPAVRRVQVGLILRNLRERAGVKPKEIAERLDWYSTKVTRVEKGELTVSAAEVEVLLTMFSVPDGAEAEQLRELAREARRRDQPAKVPDWAATYVALEGAATEIKSYDPELIHGTLQTEDYARAILSDPLDDSRDIEPAIRERLARGSRVLEGTGPSLWCVLGEAVLYREVGNHEVLREQLEHLRVAAQRPNITIQIVPFSAGQHIAVGSSWVLLHLGEPVATYAYLEGLTGSDYLDKPSHTEKYVTAFDKLRAAAASERATMAMLERRIKELI